MSLIFVCKFIVSAAAPNSIGHKVDKYVTHTFVERLFKLVQLELATIVLRYCDCPMFMSLNTNFIVKISSLLLLIFISLNGNSLLVTYVIIILIQMEQREKSDEEQEEKEKEQTESRICCKLVWLMTSSSLMLNLYAKCYL